MHVNRVAVVYSRLFSIPHVILFLEGAYYLPNVEGRMKLMTDFSQGK